MHAWQGVHACRGVHAGGDLGIASRLTVAFLRPDHGQQLLRCYCSYCLRRMVVQARLNGPFPIQRDLALYSALSGQQQPSLDLAYLSGLVSITGRTFTLDGG